VWLTGLTGNVLAVHKIVQTIKIKKIMPIIDLTQTFGRLMPLKEDRGKFIVLT